MDNLRKDNNEGDAPLNAPAKAVKNACPAQVPAEHTSQRQATGTKPHQHPEEMQRQQPSQAENMGYHKRGIRRKDDNRPPPKIHKALRVQNTSGKDRIKCVQINLHRSMAATTNLGRLFQNGKWDIALIQEPWAGNGRVKGLSSKNTGKLIYCTEAERSRTAVLYNPKLKIFPLNEFISRDLTAVLVESTHL